MKSEIKILHGDNREVMKTFADNTFHAIVTDPPYELGFMGKKWDNSGIAYDPKVWTQALRILKPGGYLLSFGGSRTYHRMACAIEDAGFEIRDMIEWLYGSGFPKSLDVSKAMDKAVGATRKVVGKATRHSGQSYKWADEIRHPTHSEEKSAITAPSTPNAQLWSGYGTALKPAHEPICVARKPLIGTVVENVLAHGAGAINIDACRIGTERRTYDLKGNAPGSKTINQLSRKDGSDNPNAKALGSYGTGSKQIKIGEKTTQGRFPANLILDEVAAAMLDEQSGQLTSGKLGAVTTPKQNAVFGKFATANVNDFEANTGGASRFFYTAKASGTDRGNNVKGALPLFGVAEEEFRNTHPTVKPVALMLYLLKLVCPMVEGIKPHVLDPFLGSGTTAIACKQLGIDCTGIELEAEHIAIANERLI
jgi:site-specific DNA-methyltransferase (adenine-specific)